MGEKMGTPEGVQRDPNGVTKSGGNTTRNNWTVHQEQSNDKHHNETRDSPLETNHDGPGQEQNDSPHAKTTAEGQRTTRAGTVQQHE